MPRLPYTSKADYDLLYESRLDTLPSGRSDVFVHYIPEVVEEHGRRNAAVCRVAFGLTNADRILVVGAGFGGLKDALVDDLGWDEANIVSLDTSPYIAATKGNDADVELDLDLPGDLTVEDRAAVHARHGRGAGVKRAKRAIVDHDVTRGNGRAALRSLIGNARYEWAITESVLESLDDAEAVTVSDAMHSIADNVGHLVVPRDDSKPAFLRSDGSWGGSQPALNWHSLDEWAALLPLDTLVSPRREKRSPV